LNSIARMRLMLRFCAIARLSPNQASGMGLAKLRGQLFAKQVFITNAGADALPLPIKRGLGQGAAIKVAQGNVHQVSKPACQRWDEFAKRHQVVLVVAPDPGLLRLQAQHRVGVALLGVAQRDANQRGAA